MPDTGAPFNLPYPQDPDGVDVPGDMQALAEATDERLRYAGAQGGKSIVAAEQSRTNTAYGLLGTPDRVQGIEVPADGVVCLLYSALWKESVSGAGRAAIMIKPSAGIDAQLKVWDTRNSDPMPQAAAQWSGGGANAYRPLLSFPAGLFGCHNPLAGFNSGVTTGQAQAIVARDSWQGEPNHWLIHEVAGEARTINASNGGGSYGDGLVLGGECSIIGLSAGSYDFSVQFKASSGSITAKNRALHVWTKEFPASGV